MTNDKTTNAAYQTRNSWKCAINDSDHFVHSDPHDSTKNEHEWKVFVRGPHQSTGQLQGSDKDTGTTFSLVKVLGSMLHYIINYAIGDNRRTYYEQTFHVRQSLIKKTGCSSSLFEKIALSIQPN